MVFVRKTLDAKFENLFADGSVLTMKLRVQRGIQPLDDIIR